MKKILASLLAATLLSFGGVATASAVEETGQCVPKDAYTTTVDHPAVGEEFILVDNPEYVPEVPGYTVPGIPAVGEEFIRNTEHVPAKTINHPAEYKTVKHEAVTKTQWKYVKHGGHGEIWVDNDDFKYVDSNGVGSNKKPDKGTFYERTQKTRTVVVKEAWTEQVLVKEAWTETIPAVGEEFIKNKDYVPAVPARDVPAVPAVGEPMIPQENEDYVAPWTETVKHPAVECETPKPTEPVTPTPTPSVTPPTTVAPAPVAPPTVPVAPVVKEKVTAAPEAESLAETGMSGLVYGYLAGGLLLVGIGLLILRRITSK